MYRYLNKKMLSAFENTTDECFYCHCTKAIRNGKETKLGFDHVIPTSRGGEHSIKNLVKCCFRCNTSKYNFSLTEWASRIEKQNEHYARNNHHDLFLKTTQILVSISVLLEDPYFLQKTEEIQKQEAIELEQFNLSKANLNEFQSR